MNWAIFLLAVIAPLPACAAGCEASVGEWKWFTGAYITVTPQKTVLADGKGVAKWDCADPKRGVIVIRWTNGFVDNLTVSGNRMSGRNQKGVPVYADRKGSEGLQGCEATVGDWKWFNGASVTLTLQRAVLVNGKRSGRWDCVDAKRGAASIQWDNGFVDAVNVSGNRLSGRNQKGISIGADRQPPPSVSRSSSARCDGAVGEWKWFTGATVALTPNKRVLVNGNEAGQWYCADVTKGITAIHWDSQFVDYVTVSGNRISGSNQQGTKVSGVRKVPVPHK